MNLLARLDAWLRPKKILWPRLEMPGYINRHYGRPALILGAGPSLRTCHREIEAFVKWKRPVVLAANNAEVPGMRRDYACFANRRRFCEYGATIPPDVRLLIGPHIPRKTIRAIIGRRKFERMPFVRGERGFSVHLGIPQIGCIECGILLFAVAYAMGCSEIFGVGFDGYVRGAVNHADPEGDVDFKIERSIERQERIKALLPEMRSYFRIHGVQGPWFLGKTAYLGFDAKVLYPGYEEIAEIPK